jgi:hypothetical protein
MPDIHFVRAELERMRMQIIRQRKDILSLLMAGIPTDSTEALLARMLAKTEDLRAERDQLKTQEPHPMKGKVLGERRW